MSQRPNNGVGKLNKVGSLVVIRDDLITELQRIGATQTYVGAGATIGVPRDSLRRTCRALHQRHTPWIRRVVRSYRVPEHAVDDCVQDVWLAVVGSLDAFNLDLRRGEFRGWLRAIIRHKVADFFRRVTKQPVERMGELNLPVTSHEPGPAESYEVHRRARIVHKSLAELLQQTSVTTYQVVSRRWMQGCDISEIASRLNLTHKGVNDRNYRGLRKLRKLIDAKDL